MSHLYDLPKIRLLLHQGLTDSQLRALCYDIPEFKLIYDQLTPSTAQVAIVQQVIDLALSASQIEKLLDFVQEYYPSLFDQYGPFQARPTSKPSTDDNLKQIPRLSPFQAGGALTDEQAKIYIERGADQEALAYLRTLEYVLVIEPRQQGKTSLVNHVMQQFVFDKISFVYIDVTTPDRFSEPDWYQTLCSRILRQLRQVIPRNEWPPIPQTSAGWRDFLSDIALYVEELDRRIVIVLDEIGAVDFPGATAFFSVLRDIYNSRQAERELRQLTFWLIGAFHPRDLIQDDKISPFNIAKRVRLQDFTLPEIIELVGRGGWSPTQTTRLAERIQFWTDGQPYLTQLLCSYLGEVATVEDVDASVERLRRDDENHLPPLLERLTADERMLRYAGKVQTEKIKFYPRENRHQSRLELLGLIKADADGHCTIRNRLYESVLALNE